MIPLEKSPIYAQGGSLEMIAQLCNGKERRGGLDDYMHTRDKIVRIGTQLSLLWCIELMQMNIPASIKSIFSSCVAESLLC